MNCKQGDLAIVVKSVAGNEGKIVRCVRFIGKDVNSDGEPMQGDDRWEVDTEMVTFLGSKVRSVQDSCLRPIRGDLLDEETEREMERTA